MTGEIFRLRKFRTYGVKQTPKVGLQWSEGSAPPGKHIVVAVLGAVPEGMELSEKFLEERMAVLGWKKAE